MALIGEGAVKRDSLLSRDYLDLGDYIKLGDDYYRFHDFYNGDGTVVLVKETSFAAQSGVQIDMLAPSFECVTMTSDTLRSTDLENSLYLLTNISGCTPSSYDLYTELIEADIKGLTVIGMESGIKKEMPGLMVDVEHPFNEKLYSLYRNAYSDYTSYLIGKDGRVLDQFKIFDWKTHLEQYIDPTAFKN